MCRRARLDVYFIRERAEAELLREEMFSWAARSVAVRGAEVQPRHWLITGPRRVHL